VTEHVRLDDVVKFLDERLEVSKFDEVESNGLIVRASDVVTRRGRGEHVVPRDLAR